MGALETYLLRAKKMRLTRVKAVAKYAMDFPEERRSLTVSASRELSLKFAVTTMQMQPMMINISAVRSYLQTNFSPRKIIAKITCTTIAVAALQDSNTMSAKGATPV